MKKFNVILTIPSRSKAKNAEPTVYEAEFEGSNMEAATGKAFRELMARYITEVVARRPHGVTLEVYEVQD